MIQPCEISGIPKKRGVLVVVDHASNHVPDDIDLGLSDDQLKTHIAVDIGVAEIATKMSENTDYLSIMGGVSRLVVDLNRYPDEDAVIPKQSDGIKITGNVLNDGAKNERLDKYFQPYHDRVAQLIKDLEPVLVLSLHSFTPVLKSDPQLERPWEMGILYNEYEIASRLALQILEEENLKVGDQLPYSGKDLNATMNRQCETVGQAYLGVEIRQDLISHAAGQQRFAEILLRLCDKIRTGLA